MKRFICQGLKVVSVLFVSTIVSGCVSQGKYDELKFAEQACQADRQRLAADLAGAKSTNAMLEGDNKRLRDILANREDVIQSLRDQLAKTGLSMEKLTKIYGDLASRGIPSGQILQAPLPPALDTALRRLQEKYPNLFEYDSARGVLKFKSDLLFELGSAEVREEVIKPLQDFAEVMKMPEAEKFDCVIVGHTDNIRIGKPATRQQHPTNWHLSVHRSISVENVLEEGGIDPQRMGVMGYGEYRPVAPNEGNRGNPLNRRVEVYIVPKQAIGERALKTSAEESSTQQPAAEETAPVEK